MTIHRVIKFLWESGILNQLMVVIPRMFLTSLSVQYTL